MNETMVKKVENDAAAYLRGIAAKRGRNAEWAEKATRTPNAVGFLAADVFAEAVRSPSYGSHEQQSDERDFVHYSFTRPFPTFSYFG